MQFVALWWLLNDYGNQLTCDFLSNASHSFAQIVFKLILYFLCSFMLVSQCLLWYLELELLKLIFSSYLLTFQLTDGLMSTAIKLERLKTLFSFFFSFLSFTQISYHQRSKFKHLIYFGYQCDFSMRFLKWRTGTNGSTWAPSSDSQRNILISTLHAAQSS